MMTREQATDAATATVEAQSYGRDPELRAAAIASITEALLARDALVQSHARLVMHAIREDVISGVVPADVPTFSALHDYTDANMYVADLPGLWSDDGHADLDIANAVTDEVNRMLDARHINPPIGTMLQKISAAGVDCDWGSTGGNCMAIIVPLTGGGELLVTAEDGPFTDLDEWVNGWAVGRYDADGVPYGETASQQADPLVYETPNHADPTYYPTDDVDAVVAAVVAVARP